MEVDAHDHGQTNGLTKENLAKIMQKGRSLIKTIRNSQILMFINKEKKALKIKRSLIIDCISRWNSTYLALQSLLEHKTVMLNLYQNKGKLPISTKQKEKLTTLEISSDNWTLINNLLDVLEPFFEATNLLSGAQYPTIGLSLFAIKSIKEYLENEDDDQSDILRTLKLFILQIRTLKLFILQSLNEYFDERDPQYSTLLVS